MKSTVAHTKRRALVRAATLLPLAALNLGALAAPVIRRAPGQKLRVAFVYVSPVAQAGWTTQHERGRRVMQAALGDKVESFYVENVPEGADAERVIRDLANQGYHLIFTPSFGFMNPTLRVAQEFPNTIFEQGTGYRTAANVGTYNARYYEGRYLAGVIAGRATRTHRAGYVAAFPIPEVLQGINAFTRGARSVDPKFQTAVVWTDAWHDPGRERDAAIALAGQGADVLTHHTDTTAVVQFAEERKLMAVAYCSDMASFGPNAQLVAVTHQWGGFYTRTVQSVLDGTWASTSVLGGVRDGMIELQGFNPRLAPDIRAQVDARQRDIASGRLHPFMGAIRSNTGQLVQAKGSMSDDTLARMNYFVEGVLGKLPSGAS